MMTLEKGRTPLNISMISKEIGNSKTTMIDKVVMITTTEGMVHILVEQSLNLYKNICLRELMLKILLQPREMSRTNLTEKMIINHLTEEVVMEEVKQIIETEMMDTINKEVVVQEEEEVVDTVTTIKEKELIMIGSILLKILCKVMI